MTVYATWLLKLSRIVNSLRYTGVATGGSTTTLINTSQVVKAEEYLGGTIWFLSGTLDGVCAVITGCSENTFTFATQASAIVAGVKYAVTSKQFDLVALMEAGNMALDDMGILKEDVTLSVTAATRSYTLPTGVRRVRQVEIAANSAEPYGFYSSYYWEEVDGKLIFDSGKEPSATGKIIRLKYYVHLGPFLSTDTVDDQVDIDWWKWQAAAMIYRAAYQLYGKDEERWSELYNEAMKNAEKYQRNNRPINQNPRLAGW